MRFCQILSILTSLLLALLLTPSPAAAQAPPVPFVVEGDERDEVEYRLSEKGWNIQPSDETAEGRIEVIATGDVFGTVHGDSSVDLRTVRDGYRGRTSSETEAVDLYVYSKVQINVWTPKGLVGSQYEYLTPRERVVTYYGTSTRQSYPFLDGWWDLATSQDVEVDLEDVAWALWKRTQDEVLSRVIEGVHSKAPTISQRFGMAAFGPPSVPMVPPPPPTQDWPAAPAEPVSSTDVDRQVYELEASEHVLRLIQTELEDGHRVVLVTKGQEVRVLDWDRACPQKVVLEIRDGRYVLDGTVRLRFPDYRK